MVQRLPREKALQSTSFYSEVFLCSCFKCSELQILEAFRKVQVLSLSLLFRQAIIPGLVMICFQDIAVIETTVVCSDDASMFCVKEKCYVDTLSKYTPMSCQCFVLHSILYNSFNILPNRISEQDIFQKITTEFLLFMHKLGIT